MKLIFVVWLFKDTFFNIITKFVATFSNYMSHYLSRELLDINGFIIYQTLLDDFILLSGKHIGMKTINTDESYA